MSDPKEEQKKWISYGFWVVAFALAVLAILLFANIFNNQFKPIPDGYLFSVSDHTTQNIKNWATYYVYDTYILVDKESPEENSSKSTALIYDGIDTSGLKLDENDLAEFCDADACYKYPKVLDAIKKALINRPSREYTRL